MLISKEKPLIFVHQPKTAGMSLFAAFASAFGNGVADLYNMTSADPEPAGALLSSSDYCVYAGHFSFGLHEWLTRPAYYFSVVRNPVDRILSLYLYVSEYRRLFHKAAQETRKPLREIVFAPSSPDFYHDYLDWISGPDTLRAFLTSPSLELDNGMVRRFSGFGLRAEPCPAEALTQAKLNIERCFPLIGVQERYPETLKLLGNAFELPGLSEFRVNQTREKAAFSDGVRGFIARMNPLDLALYEWLCERFERQSQTGVLPETVPGGGRSDFGKLVLWKAVGKSPMRDAMKDGRPPANAVPLAAAPL